MSDVNITVSTIPINIEVNTDPTVFITAAVGGVQPPVQSMSGYLTSGETQDLFLTSGEASLLYYGIDNPFGYITDTGNQDISGTKNFLGNLQLNGNSVLTGEYVSVGGNSLDHDLVLGTDDAYGLDFKTSGIPRLSISNSGNILAAYAKKQYAAFGTTTPNSTYKYHFLNDNNGSPDFGRLMLLEGKFTGSQFGVASMFTLKMTAMNNSPTLQATGPGMLFAFQNNSGVENFIGRVSVLTDGTADNIGRMYFDVSNSGTMTNIMSLLNNRRVGINNGSPNYTLDVNGSGNFANGVYWNGAPVLTGVNLSSYALQSSLDAVSGDSTLVRTSGLQIITGTKYFDTAHVNNLFVDGTQTVINTQVVDVDSNYLNLNASGGVRDAGVFISFDSGKTSGAYIGYDVPSNTWRFGSGTSGLDLSSLDYVASQNWVNNQNFAAIGGNTKGTGITLGTNDSYNLNFETSGVSRMSIGSGGGVTISSPSDVAQLLIKGNSAQTNYLTAWYDSNNNFLGYINNIGQFRCEGGIAYAGGTSRISNMWFNDRSIYGSNNLYFYSQDGDFALASNSLSTSGTYLNVGKSGFVGIGVNGSSRLHVSGASGQNLLQVQGAGSIEGLFISSGGKVGIGTVIPVYNLEVVGSGSFSNNLLVSGAMGIGGAANNATEKLGIKYGHVRFTSVPVPAAPTVALAGLGSGNLINDSYQYAISFVTNMGETAFGSFSSYGVVTDYTTDGQIRLTNIPTGTTPGVTYVGRNIYRRHLVDPQGFWMYYITGLNDNTTTTWVDNVNLGIGTALPPQSDGLADTSTAVFYKNNNKAITIASNSSFGELALRDAGSNTAFNNAIGANALLALKTGRYNQAFGNYTISSFVNGDANHAFGNGVLQYLVNGGGNIGMGYNTMSSLRSGDDNIAIGYRTCSMFQGVGNIAIGSRSIGDSAVPIGTNTNMLYNTAIGYLAGYSLVTGASRNVFLGSYAGRYEGGSNTLIIDSFDRSTSGASISGALIYGKFNNTASSQTLTLGGGGNVGIGTFTPPTLLSLRVTGDTPGPVFSIKNRAGNYDAMTMGWGTNGYNSEFGFGGGAGFYLNFKNNASNLNVMTLSDGGSVIIGTQSGARLSVQKASAPTGVSSNDSYFLADMGSSLGGAEKYATIAFGYRNYVNPGAYISYLNQVGGGFGKGALTFGLRADSAADNPNTEYMRITSSGDIGIGTTTPSARLQIETDTAGNGLYADADIRIGYKNGANHVYNNGTIWLGDGPNYKGVIDYNYINKLLTIDGGRSVGNIALKTAAGEVMRLTTAGNVGINTSSPVSNLDVSGAISAASLNATGMVSASQYGSIFASPSSVGGLITLSFLTGDHFVTISSGGNYTVTGINIPSGNVVLSTSAFIYNTGYTGALAFPSDWTFMGSLPVSLPSGKSSILSLKSYGSKVVAGYSIQY